ncbi:hypothetical protein Tco_1439702 [Tanacetum coccineum]
METKDTLSSCSNSDEQQMQRIQDKAKKSCMVFFRILHSHLKLLSNNDLKGTRTECGFKRAFAKLFRQDVQIFTGTMFLNMDQLEKQLDKDEFQEIGSMAAFRVLETHCQKFIKSCISLYDEDGIMTRKYFLEYTQLEVQQFRDTLIQHMESVKKSIDKRALHKREYDSRVNEKQMQTKERKVDTSKALDASLVDTKSSGTESREQDTSSGSMNDADIKPVYDEEPMAESERPRISKSRFASQVDVNNDLSKLVTAHYLPKERASAFAKPHHVIASSESRNSSKSMPRFSSNNMVYNHYLEEAKKKTQERGRNSRPSVMPPAKSQSITNDSKPKPRINNQRSRNWPASKSSCETTKTVPIAEHSKNSRIFSDSKHFVCSTSQNVSLMPIMMLV